MRRSLVTFAVSTALLTACGTRATLPPLPAAAQGEYMPYAIAGSATVFGSAFLVTRSGDVKRGAARQVLLIPETSVVRAAVPNDDTGWPSLDWLTSQYAEQSVASVWVHTRSTVADVEGKFAFERVPAGRYIVETRLTWQYMNCGFFGCRLSDTGAVLRKRITVNEDGRVEAQLTTVITS